MHFSNTDGSQITVAEYFKKTYKKNLTKKDQPLFVSKLNGKEIYIPSELCTLDGISDDLRNDKRALKDVMGEFRRNPNQKYDEIEKFGKRLFDQQPLKDWGLSIDSKPQEIDSQILPVPQIVLRSKETLSMKPNEIRNLAIQNPVSLMKEKWIFVYDDKHYSLADGIYSNLVQSSDKLGIIV